MGEPFDVIVVGGGHNGLVAAGLLAKRGARVTVLERRSNVGGAATTEQPWGPAYKMSALSYVVSLIPPEIVRDLELARHGYKIHSQNGYFVPYRDGRALQLPDNDPARRHAQIAQFSRADADAYAGWDTWLGGLADVLGPLLSTIPPRLGSTRPGDLVGQARLAWSLRRLGVAGVGDVTRLFTASIADLLDEWFTSPQMQGVLSVSGVIGTWAGPRSPGTAFVMAHHKIGDAGEGQLGSWGFPEGGMGAVSDALRAAATAAGAIVRTDAPVARIDVQGGRVRGVTLESGEELRADVVVAATHPKITFLDQIDRNALPADFVAAIERWKTRSGTVKVNVAVDRLPEFTAKPGFDPEVHGGTIVLAESLDDIEHAFQDAVGGRAAALPFADICIPSVFDRTLAPEGEHVVSMFTQWVPHTWASSPSEEGLAAYADRVIARVDDVAPGFTDSILHRQVIGPYEMEHEYGLIGGNIFHGELSPDQLFHSRPAPGYADFRTPIAGLYQASSATHGGGGVTGIPGLNATRQIMHDPRAGGGAVRRTRYAIGAIAFMALALVSVSTATAGADDPLQLTVGSLQRIGSLDPRRGTSEIAREVWKLEYPTLTTLDPKTLDPRPGLASAWTPAPNGRGWIYRLRRGLTWSDGKPVTAADVVYSLNHARDERWPYAKNMLDDLTARALDSNTVEVSRRAGSSTDPEAPADPTFPGLLLHVVPEHVFSKFSDIDKDAVKRSVSDGTWRVTERSDDSVQLDVPAGVVGPPVTRILFRTYRSADAMVDALSHGDVDVISGLPSSYIGRLHALPDATVNHSGDGTQYTLSIGKRGDAALDDPRVRQAISMAIDRDQLVESAVRGVGTAGVVAPIARGKSWALDDAKVQSLTESLDAQPGRARELLASAPPIGRKLTILVPFDRAGRRTGTFVRRALAAVGIETELASPEGVEPDLLLAHTAIGSDPTDALSQMTCEDCAERLRQYRSTDDDTARFDAAHDMSEQATEQATNLGLFQPDTLQAFRSDNVTGFLRDPEVRSLVVFGPTISQYSQLSTAFPPPGEQLGNTSYIVGGLIVLALCVATFMVVVWIRRRYAS